MLNWRIRITGCAMLVAFLLLSGRIVLADEESPKGTAKHVVVIVFDGLRPDSVTQADMPTLYQLARKGTVFAHHHSIYPSSTEVNGTALATGALPRHSGIMANDEYRPELELLHPIETQDRKEVKNADAMTGGLYLRMPTLAEIVKQAGLRTVVAGTKPVALLLDRAKRKGGDPSKDNVLVFEGRTHPKKDLAAIEQDGSSFPAIADATKSANRDQDVWTTRVLIDRLWAGDIPAFTMLWMSEPDFAQHGSGPGSAVARSALKSDDDNLESVIGALQKANALDATDLMVVSDHGFSTIERTLDMVQIIRKGGFDAAAEFHSQPTNGQVMVVSLGGSTCFYVIGHDAAESQRLVEFLQSSDFAGVIFSRTPIDGTFPLSRIGIDTPDAPDVVLSNRWDDQTSQTGLPGMLMSSAIKFHPGQGYHASLSRFDMHNTLIAIGPDFRQGFVDQTPSGNIDIAPTALSILGLAPSKPMDGRILSEALRDWHGATPEAHTQIVQTNHEVGGIHWQQYLKLTTVGSTTYFDEGNAGDGPALSQ